MNKMRRTGTRGSNQDHAEVLLVLASSLGLDLVDLGLKTIDLLVQLLEQVLDVAQRAGSGGGFLDWGHDVVLKGEEGRRVKK
jgi:hypothetical protein